MIDIYNLPITPSIFISLIITFIIYCNDNYIENINNKTTLDYVKLFIICFISSIIILFFYNTSDNNISEKITQYGTDLLDTKIKRELKKNVKIDNNVIASLPDF